MRRSGGVWPSVPDRVHTVNGMMEMVRDKDAPREAGQLPDADDMEPARETLGEGATAAEVEDLAAQRVAVREGEETP